VRDGVNRLRVVMKRKKYCMGTDSRRVKRGKPDAASDWVGGDG